MHAPLKTPPFGRRVGEVRAQSVRLLGRYAAR
jgi:hypothetical protein